MVSGDDAELVRRCLRGDPAAFEPLVDRYQKPLFNLAFRMTGNYEDARDVAQSALLRAYERLRTFDPRFRFFSWIYRIVINESLNHLAHRRPSEPLDESIAASANPHDQAAQAEASDRIQAALLRLTADQREVVVLRHFAGLSYDEIGETLQLPSRTVKSRLFSARQRLGVILAEAGLAP